MVFIRSTPARHYRDYTRYRELLRHDFQHRCAYCLIREFHNGGSANFTIDHFRPRRGAFARPDLEAVYINLYWVCRECNENKADIWPDLREQAQGFGWIDPCEPWGDHELHWRMTPRGEVQWLTPLGEYTVTKLRLDTREDWKAHRQLELRLGQMRDSLVRALAEILRQQIAETDHFLNPPVFDRSRRRKHRDCQRKM